MGKHNKIGYVISQNSLKTISVLLISTFFHFRYKKMIKKISRILVHDNFEQCQIGDKVLIREISPISKHKYFILQSILLRKLKKK